MVETGVVYWTEHKGGNTSLLPVYPPEQTRKQWNKTRCCLRVSVFTLVFEINILQEGARYEQETRQGAVERFRFYMMPMSRYRRRRPADDDSERLRVVLVTKTSPLNVVSKSVLLFCVLLPMIYCLLVHFLSLLRHLCLF